VCNTFDLDVNQRETIDRLGIKGGDFDPCDPVAFAEFLNDDSEGFDIIVCPPSATGLTPDIIGEATKGKIRRLRAVACSNDSLKHLQAIVDTGEIDILHTTDVHRSAVAEYTLLQLGSELRKLAKFASETGQNGAFPHDAACTETRLLAGKVLGVIGITGKDGSAVAELGTKLSMKVLGYSRSGRGTVNDSATGIEMVSMLDDLVSRADLISMNVRLSIESKGIIDANKIALMKPGVVIVNPAGGELIEPEALLAEFSRPVEERIISSLTLDMPYGGERGASAFEADPINSKLKSLGVVFTPRMAGYALDVIEDSDRKLCALIDGHLDQHREDETLRLFRVLRAAVVEAGRTVKQLRSQPTSFDYKSDGSPVSDADRYSENSIRDHLSRAGFTFSFLGEELGEAFTTSPLTVIVDGIDGTRNYRDGNFGWCVSALVRHNGIDLCSVVYDPVCDVVYSAVKGAGAFIQIGNEQEAPMRIPAELPDDFSFSIGSFFIKESRTIKKAISDAIKDLGGRGREWGSVALSILAVGRGGFGAFLQGRSATYDHGAAVFIARESGAAVHEREVQGGRNDVLVCHPLLYEQVLRIYNEAAG